MGDTTIKSGRVSDPLTGRRSSSNFYWGIYVVVGKVSEINIFSKTTHKGMQLSVRETIEELNDNYLESE
jgi:hypothetical protein